MIIFELDGTLANCEHRRHFVDSSRPHPSREESEEFMLKGCKWEPDWKAFYEACYKDTPIWPVVLMLEYLGKAREYGSDTPWVDYANIEIWSGRCESVRKKTEFNDKDQWNSLIGVTHWMPLPEPAK